MIDLRGGPMAHAVRRHRLIAVLRRVEPRDRLLTLVTELADAGVRIFEVTLDSDQGADDLVAVRELLAARAEGAFFIGAGTVIGPARLTAARRAGADFAVSPLLELELVREAVASGLAFVPGALTPTEIARAWDAGATFVKLFPASSVGPSFVRELRGPMPDVQLIPTGGIDGTNAGGFLEAGAAAVGIGGALVRATPDERRALVEAVG